MAKMNLSFRKPPESALTGSKSSAFYRDVSEALRENPGEWAVLPRRYSSTSSAQSAAGNIRRGVIQAMPKGHYESVVDDMTVYVRFVGKDGIYANDEPDDGDGDPAEHPPRIDNAKVRAWAAEQGIELAQRGRIPAEVIAKYELAQYEDPETDEDADEETDEAEDEGAGEDAATG